MHSETVDHPGSKGAALLMQRIPAHGRASWFASAESMCSFAALECPPQPVSASIDAAIQTTAVTAVPARRTSVASIATIVTPVIGSHAADATDGRAR